MKINLKNLNMQLASFDLIVTIDVLLISTVSINKFDLLLSILIYANINCRIYVIN